MSDGAYSVGFLRAVNVGGRTVTKEQLCSILDEPRLGTVSTFLASGNVLFRGPSGTAAEIETLVEAALESALGYTVETFVRSVAEVAAMAADPVFAPAEGVAVHVGFLRVAPPAAAIAALMRLATPEDQLEARGPQIWWRREGRVSDSPLSTAAFGRALGQPGTLRTLRTLQRLGDRYSS